MDRVHYSINGLGSAVNKTQVKNALEKMEGVQQVCVDLQRGTVEVMYNDSTNEVAIRGCIENAGFSIN